MAATLADAMYTGSTQPGFSGGYPSYDYRSGYPGSIARSYSYGRPPIEPPRPLEPRPTLHTSLSESAGASRHQNVPHGPLSPEHRSQVQNLPALKDILSPGSHPSPHSPYAGSWNHTTAVSANHSRADSQYAPPDLHPPMTLYPPSDNRLKYQPSQTSPFEVPVLQTSPIARHPPQTTGIPQYASYPEPRREYAEYRPERQPTEPRGAFINSHVPHQYNTTTPVESQYQGPFGPNDATSGTPYTPTASDNRGSYLGVQDVPGEGTFYVYEGGQRIPTHVDGEQVNPAWGLTKANKPRKRLALACLDCREKKIKCEPGLSSCLQCEKAKRTCRRAPAQTAQPESTTGSWPTTAGSPNRSRFSNSDPTPAANRDVEPDPLNKRRTREDPSPPNVPSKKHRSTSPVRSPENATSPPREEMVGISQTSPKTTTSPAIQRRQSEAHYEWEVDPFSVDSGLTTYLVNLYSAHINDATYCIYPRSHFLNWLRTHQEKCQNERMILYAMLAAATSFADEALSGLGKHFAAIAGQAVSSQYGKFSVTSAQTHMILSLYHFAKGANDTALAHYGSALHSVRHQGLNTESSCVDDSSTLGQPRRELALSKEQMAECKRRTFWSVFLMDRCCGANSCDIKSDDIFVRLPCSDDMYERSIASDAPYLSNGIMDPTKSIITAASPISPMAWLMIVAMLWGNALDCTFRAWFSGQQGYSEFYNTFYKDTVNGLQGWRSRLPQHMQYSVENLDRSIQQGYGGAFIAMHTLYYLTQIKINRYLRHKDIPGLVSRNLRAAHDNAHELLRLIGSVQNARRSIASPMEGQPTAFALSTPFTGYATLAAIDIVSAGGWESMLGPVMQEMFDGLGCLGELAVNWASAKDQLKACQTRYYQIQNILQRRSSKQGAWLGKKWGLERPLEQDFDDPDYDCIWGLGNSDAIYFETLKQDENDGKQQPGGLRIA